jgi:hypothetical protein
VNLDKALRVEVLSEELTYTGLYSENSLVGGCLEFSETYEYWQTGTHSKIHDSVIESSWQGDFGELDILGLHLTSIRIS